MRPWESLRRRPGRRAGGVEGADRDMEFVPLLPRNGQKVAGARGAGMIAALWR